MSYNVQQAACVYVYIQSHVRRVFMFTSGSIFQIKITISTIMSLLGLEHVFFRLVMLSGAYYHHLYILYMSITTV